jgi:N-acetylglutamate synthase-like GNAT family acetyltransferase
MRSIRKAALDDVSAISARDREFASRGRESFARMTAERECLYTLEEDGTVIGLGVLEYTFFEQGFISLVYVIPSARRTGAGEMLLRYFVSVCKTPKLFSSTNRSNKPMQALFAKAGFQLSGIIHNLDPNDPEIVYYKEMETELRSEINLR